MSAPCWLQRGNINLGDDVPRFCPLAPAEGLSHAVPGAGAGKPEGGARDQDQPTAPEGEEADGDGQTGERGAAHTLETVTTLSLADLSDVSLLQVEANVKLEECLKKLQQENEDYKARMDKHAALSRWVEQSARQMEDVFSTSPYFMSRCLRYSVFTFKPNRFEQV